MARDVTARAEIDIVHDAKRLEKLHAARGRFVCRVVGRFRRGNELLSRSSTTAPSARVPSFADGSFLF